MKIPAGPRLSTLALGVALSAAMVSPCWAQLDSGVPGGGGGAIATGRRNPTPPKPTIAPADAMPGATAREPAAPATRAAGDMQPTEALFDAINRGDIASARDALSRGADLNGVNILGMTPMELSVDLGRNDISFLLLSMRGEDSGRGSRTAGREAAAPAAQAVKPPAPVKGTQIASKPIPVRPTEAKAVATPKLFANDGGTPLPNAGFLGFGSRPSSN